MSSIGQSWAYKSIDGRLSDSIYNKKDVLVSVSSFLHPLFLVLSFRLVTKAARAAFDVTSKHYYDTLLISWKRLRCPIRGLLILAKLFPRISGLTFNYIPMSISYEDVISVGTLFPDVKTIEFCIPGVTKNQDFESSLSPARSGRSSESWRPPRIGEPSILVDALIRRCRLLTKLSMRTISGDISSALDSFGMLCPGIQIIDVGSPNCNCACTWASLANCIADCDDLVEILFFGHVYEQDGLHENVQVKLSRLQRIEKFQIGGRFTARMLRDCHTIIANAKNLCFGRTSEITVRSILDIFELNDSAPACRSLSITAKGSPQIVTNSLVSLIKKCTELEELRCNKLHELNHHLMNALLLISHKLKRVEIKDYMNYFSGQPTAQSKLRLIANLPCLRALALSDISDRMVQKIFECCPCIETLIAQHSFRVTDSSVKFIRQLNQLRFLQLDCTSISKKGILEVLNAPLGSRLQSLKLWINNVEDDYDNDHFLVQIVLSGRSLKELRLFGIDFTPKLSEMLGKIPSPALQVFCFGSQSRTPEAIFDEIRMVWPHVCVEVNSEPVPRDIGRG